MKKNTPTRKFLLSISEVIKESLITYNSTYKQLSRDILAKYQFDVSENSLRIFAKECLGIEKNKRLVNEAFTTKEDTLIDKALEYVKDEVKDKIGDKVQEHFKDEISYLKDEVKEVAQELNPKVFEKLNESLASFIGEESKTIKKTKDIFSQA